MLAPRVRRRGRTRGESREQHGRVVAGMDRTVTATCAKCQRLEVRVDALQSDIASLPKLRVAARKDSTTSSKSPSSDIVKPKPAPDTDGTSRSIGDGMHGYPMHHREPFPVEGATHFE